MEKDKKIDKVRIIENTTDFNCRNFDLEGQVQGFYSLGGEGRVRLCGTFLDPFSVSQTDVLVKTNKAIWTLGKEKLLEVLMGGDVR